MSAVAQRVTQGERKVKTEGDETGYSFRHFSLVMVGVIHSPECQES